jgi:hypothetical protein
VWKLVSTETGRKCQAKDDIKLPEYLVYSVYIILFPKFSEEKIAVRMEE